MSHKRNIDNISDDSPPPAHHHDASPRADEPRATGAAPTPSPTNSGPPSRTAEASAAAATKVSSSTLPSSDSSEAPSARSEASDAASEVSSHSSHPLTEGDIVYPATPPRSLLPVSSEAASDTGSEAASNAGSDDAIMSIAEQRVTLGYANIFFDRQVPIPKALSDHINELKATRSAPPSPAAKQIVAMAHQARQANEHSARETYARVLLLLEASEGGHEWVARREDLNMSRAFHPPIVDEVAIKLRRAKEISIAQPDTSTGYVPSHVCPGNTSVPFERKEESIINEMFNVFPNGDMYFPFHTVQWKSSQSNDEAIPQGARDGAVMVLLLRKLFPNPAEFKNFDEYLVHTSHFSSTFDGRSLIFFVHWFDAAEEIYRMEFFDAYHVDLIDSVERFRRILRNMEDWAMGSRLTYIKKALALRFAETPSSNGNGTGTPRKRARMSGSID